MKNKATTRNNLLNYQYKGMNTREHKQHHTLESCEVLFTLPNYTDLVEAATVGEKVRENY